MKTHKEYVNLALKELAEMYKGDSREPSMDTILTIINQLIEIDKGNQIVEIQQYLEQGLYESLSDINNQLSYIKDHLQGVNRIESKLSTTIVELVSINRTLKDQIDG